MGEEVNKSGGDDDACTKLLQNDEKHVCPQLEEAGEEDGAEDADGAADEEDEENSYSQRNIVVSVWACAGDGFCVAADAVLDAGVVVTVAFSCICVAGRLLLFGSCGTSKSNRDVGLPEYAISSGSSISHMSSTNHVESYIPVGLMAVATRDLGWQVRCLSKFGLDNIVCVVMQAVPVLMIRMCQSSARNP